MPALPTPPWVKQLFGPDAVSRPLESVEQVVERRWLELPYVNREEDLPEVASRQEIDLWTRDGLTTRGELYVPASDPPFPTFLYLHGGGWCHGSAASTRRIAMRIAAQGFLTLNLSYGLAPEHPFPRAVEDAVYAARWLATEGAAHGGDGRVAAGGDSAGANLALAAMAYVGGGAPGEAIEEGDRAGAGVNFSAALLLYGIYDFALLVGSPAPPSGTVELMFNAAYLGPAHVWRHRQVLVSPIRATTIASFPPCYIACGDEDYLLPQSLALAGALAAANVPTTLSVVSGVSHAFAQLDLQVPAAAEEMERAFVWLRGRHAERPARAPAPARP